MASHTARTTSSETDVPVGLLGEVRKTTSGRVSRICAAALSGSMLKSSSRQAANHSVPVTLEISGCME